MLKGEKLTYIRHERNTGVGNKSGKPYDFANITLSDGIESFKLDLKPELTEYKEVAELKKGDKITITVDIFERFKETSYIVSEIRKLA